MFYKSRIVLFVALFVCLALGTTACLGQKVSDLPPPVQTQVAQAMTGTPPSVAPPTEAPKPTVPPGAPATTTPGIPPPAPPVSPTVGIPPPAPPTGPTAGVAPPATPSGPTPGVPPPVPPTGNTPGIPPPASPPPPVQPTAQSDPWGLSTMSVADAQKWLSSQIGGQPEKWTPRNDQHTVWGYWDPDVLVTFRHPGSNSMLTYWKDFPEPDDARGCWVQIPKKSDRWDGTTRSLQCPTPGATFTADGVGFHPIAPVN